MLNINFLLFLFFTSCNVEIIEEHKSYYKDGSLKEVYYTQQGKKQGIYTSLVLKA